jgi:hypothetical protein
VTMRICRHSPTRAVGASARRGSIGLFVLIGLVTHRVIPEDVYVMSADGSGLRNLTNSSAADTDPIWLRPY